RRRAGDGALFTRPARRQVAGGILDVPRRRRGLPWRLGADWRDAVRSASPRVDRMTAEDRIQALRTLGFTPRQAAFLVSVARHSGYCLRRQYAAFARVRHGKNVRGFLDRLVARGLADRFVVRADRGHVYHLHSRALYRAIGEEESRHRRPVGPALIARKLMLLDAVIGRADGEWLATDEEKSSFFVDRMGVSADALTTRRLMGAESTAASPVGQ